MRYNPDFGEIQDDNGNALATVGPQNQDMNAVSDEQHKLGFLLAKADKMQAAIVALLQAAELTETVLEGDPDEVVYRDEWFTLALVKQLAEAVRQNQGPFDEERDESIPRLYVNLTVEVDE